MLQALIKEHKEGNLSLNAMMQAIEAFMAK